MGPSVLDSMRATAPWSRQTLASPIALFLLTLGNAGCRAQSYHLHGHKDSLLGLSLLRVLYAVQALISGSVLGQFRSVLTRTLLDHWQKIPQPSHLISPSSTTWVSDHWPAISKKPVETVQQKRPSLHVPSSNFHPLNPL